MVPEAPSLPPYYVCNGLSMKRVHTDWPQACFNSFKDRSKGLVLAGGRVADLLGLLTSRGCVSSHDELPEGGCLFRRLTLRQS